MAPLCTRGFSCGLSPRAGGLRGEAKYFRPTEKREKTVHKKKIYGAWFECPTTERHFNGKLKVKSAYEPSAPSGRDLSPFPYHETTRSI